MSSFIYNGLAFELRPAGSLWDLIRRHPDGTSALVGTGLFGGHDARAARERAHALVRLAYPAGVRLVPPDLTHPARAGNLRLVVPDVSRALFSCWVADGHCFPRQIAAGAIESERDHGHQE